MRQSSFPFVQRPHVKIAPYRCSLVCSLSLVVLAACSPKGPTPEDFRHALQTYFDIHPICLPVAFKLPADMRAADTVFRAPLDALVAAGLAHVQTTQHQEIGTVSGTERPGDMRHYELTDAGQAVVRPGRDRFLGGSQICFAHTEIVAVESVSPPADQALSAGHVRVTYRYRLTGTAPWTERADIRAAIPGIARMLASNSGTATDTLALGDHGWARVGTQPAP